MPIHGRKFAHASHVRLVPDLEWKKKGYFVNRWVSKPMSLDRWRKKRRETLRWGRHWSLTTIDRFYFSERRERERKKNVVTFQYNSKLIFSMSCLNEFDDAFVVYLTIDFAVRSKVKSMSRLKEKGHWRRETPLRRVRPCRRRSSDSSRSTPNIRCRHRRASVALDFEPLFPSPVSNSVRRDSTKFADPSEDPFAFQREQSESSDSNDVHGITNKWWHFETTED